MSVFTLDLDGSKDIRPIELVSKVSVSDYHIVCHLILSDGRELFVSGGHPTSDDRDISEFNSGDILDGAELVSIEKIRYRAGYTYDLLPAGDTGFTGLTGFCWEALYPRIQAFISVRLFGRRIKLSTADVRSKALYYKTISCVLMTSVKIGYILFTGVRPICNFFNSFQ